jgi:hypothetical protein
VVKGLPNSGHFDWVQLGVEMGLEEAGVFQTPVPRQAQVFFDTLMVGNLAEKSLAFSAIFTAI